jgi:CRISPR-associated protein Cas2
MAEMLMIFCYDIERARVRRRVAALLEAEAVRVQKSVFEVRMDPDRAAKLARRAARLLDPCDSLRLYAVDAHGMARSRAWGPLPLPEAQDFYLL